MKCLEYLHAHLPELAVSLQSEKGICLSAAGKSLATLPPAESAALITSLLEVAGTAQAQLKRCKGELERVERVRYDAEAEAWSARRQVTSYKQAVDQVLSRHEGMQYNGYEGSRYESMRSKIHELAGKDVVYLPRATAGALEVMFCCFFIYLLLCLLAWR